MKISATYFIVSLILFQSCRTIKHVEIVKTVTDSIAVHERDSLVRVYKLDSAAWANERKIRTETGIVFETENINTSTAGVRNTVIGGDAGYEPTTGTGMRFLGNKLEFYPNGTLKSAQGKIKSLNINLEDWQKEAYNWKKSLDSISHLKDSLSVVKSSKSEILFKDKKVTVTPWWFWILLIPAVLIGWYIRHKFK